MSLPSINEMTTSRAPIFKFDGEGSEVKGIILHHESQHANKFGTSEPDFWDDGKPKIQVMFVLQTELRDPEIEDDDGQRRLYAEPGRMVRAVLEARDEAGLKTIDPGDHLAMRLVGYGESKTKGFKPPRLFKAWLKKGTPPKPLPDLNADDAPF